jgi:hypothetical protein
MIYPNSPISTRKTITQPGSIALHNIMPSRLKSLLADLPRLELPKEPVDRFTLFQKLPIELQNKIWEIIAFQQRAVALLYNSGESHLPALYTQPPIPPILLVSREVGQEALRFYRPCAQRWPSSRRHWSEVVMWRIVYTNFVADQFIMVSPNSSFNVLDCNVHSWILGGIQTLTIDHTGYLPTGLSIGSMNAPDFLGLLSYLPRIKHLNIMVRNWCAQVGVNQGVGQELWREELRKKFLAHFEAVLKDAQLKPTLVIRFIDWNDSDAAPCSADVEREQGWRYFNPVGNRYEW